MKGVDTSLRRSVLAKAILDEEFRFSMADITAEKFAQRAFDCDLVDAHQLESIWGEFGSRDVPLDQFTGLMVRRELLTNFQVDRIVEGKRDGYFYGNYKVLYMVGAGTFARVYRALHRDTKRDRAVKVLRKRYADDVVTTEQFLREARMVMPLRHPNIVPVYEVLEEHHRPFMVMDFIEGQNLRDFIKVRKRLELDVALRLLGRHVGRSALRVEQGCDAPRHEVVQRADFQSRSREAGRLRPGGHFRRHERRGDCRGSQPAQYRLCGIGADHGRSEERQAERHLLRRVPFCITCWRGVRRCLKPAIASNA